ncbi:MAG: isoprenoid biosynthesis glyoxalase ElbB [Candidatus Eisenbacteria bacterium]|uniref:Isoprenoid biosynthesis glyoxalase ElbB n=1 Tax=Eiseniibacteriota bacterium TaxID=2212470 RepID=A0A948RW59_UNCEI|nr:isoprenoid biosynthesis glyoxalase ElbB [Candidatus Eisenbacteria bacterium]MBU1948420.1 isoprenoid biosynthesis glyoxalase ElbB [Candidatus Eisenbacteria bacterium]MBU2692133.1 isoprenoid biosynthesis glyoxalase ElbB [Candidatus Eisenbacteria bacterium]
MLKVGVILSGCGVFDGTEIHEAVAALIALDRKGAEIIYMAPNGPAMHVINHLSNETTGESRNILVESARIARGNIRDLAEVKAADIDALVIPGGFGAAKNLCNFAVKGADCVAHPQVARLIREVHRAGKPIGAMCIAPALVARVLGRDVAHLELTIGNDPGTAKALEAMGAYHINKSVKEVHVDVKNRVVTTPAYMLGSRVSEIAAGADKLVEELLRLVS